MRAKPFLVRVEPFFGVRFRKENRCRLLIHRRSSHFEASACYERNQSSSSKPSCFVSGVKSMFSFATFPYEV